MKGRFTVHHYLWFAAIAVAIVLGVLHLDWWVPLAAYFVGEAVLIFILALSKGKIKKLPMIITKAAKVAWRRSAK